ncbi:MAG TPA: hypothetical protein VF339_18955 [Gammaproteobacteria bacterium]
METLANVLSALQIDEFVNAYDLVWPVCEILHFFGMALLIGTVGAADLRMLGAFKGVPIRALERYLPLGVAGFVINLLTGLVFVAGNPVGGPGEYLTNLSFQIKMLLVLIAGINVLVFYFGGIARAADAVPSDGDAPPGAKLIAGVSLVVWIAVIFFGRLIMYNDTLLYALGL